MGGKVNVRLTVCSILILHVQFAKTKVTKGNVSAVIKKDILRLKVTVDHLESMQAFQGTKQFSSVETCTVDIETLFSLQVVEQFTTINERQNEI